jgi:hypothetical protein
MLYNTNKSVTVAKKIKNMNALELADALKNMESGWFDDLTLIEAATMLREQQGEIKALKAENKFFKDLMGDVEILKKVIEK